jgi:hypothetical protein
MNTISNSDQIFNQRINLLKLTKRHMILETFKIIDLKFEIGELLDTFENDHYEFFNFDPNENIIDDELKFIFNNYKKSFESEMTLLTNYIKNIIGISQYTYTIKKHSMMRFFKICFNIIEKTYPPI